MQLSRSRLADVGLVVLGAATVAAAVAVAAGGPDPASAVDEPRSSSATSTVTTGGRPTPDRAGSERTVDALFVGADLGGDTLPGVVGEALGWQVQSVPVDGVGFASGPEGRRFLEQLPPLFQDPAVDVVVISAGRADATAPAASVGSTAAFVLNAARERLPQARVVLVGPVITDGSALLGLRTTLQAAAARYGAYYVDAPGRALLDGNPALAGADGTLTGAGQRAVGAAIADALRRNLTPVLLPSPAPSPSA